MSEFLRAGTEADIHRISKALELYAAVYAYRSGLITEAEAKKVFNSITDEKERGKM